MTPSDEHATLTVRRSAKVRRWVLALAPLAVALVLGFFLHRGLSLDPSHIPSALINKPVPAFDLAPVKGRVTGLTAKDLTGEVTLLNVFASWCVACRVEHPLLVEMKQSGEFKVHGLNYKDKPDDAAEWLAKHGDPYHLTGADRDGRTAIEFGVYGVPETFIIGPDGVIAEKIIGPISREILDKKIRPLVESLRR